MPKEGKFQTRSLHGALEFFDTFKEALDYAAKTRVEALELSESGTPGDEIDEVWKISFSLETKERIRLVFEAGIWVLRQMDDEIERIRKERQPNCVVCGKPSIQWNPNGSVCADHVDDGTRGTTC